MNEKTNTAPVIRPAARASYLGKSHDFRMSCPEWGPDPLQIQNISVSGAKLHLLNQGSLYFRPGEEYEVLLHLRDHFNYWIQIKVIYVKNDSIGIQFVSPTPRLQQLIKIYFKTELAGAKLQRQLANQELARWQTANDQVEAGFENGKLSFLSFSLGSLAYNYKWRPGAETTKALDHPEETWVRVIRNITDISPEHRQAIESAISSQSAPD